MSNRGLYIDFRKEVPVMTITAGTAATGADNSVNLISFGKHALEMQYEGASTDIGFTRSTSGLIIPNDNTDNEGVELYTSALADANIRGQFKVGTDPAFWMWGKIIVPDVSDYDVACVGLRKAAAVADVASHAATITAYTDCALLNLNAGAIYTGTRLNSGAGVLTDTTQTVADGVAMTFAVKVSAAGVVTFLVDGAAPTVNTNTLTFDSTDVVVPFMHFTKNASAASDTPPILVELYADLQ